MIIECRTCPVRGQRCDDCVVSVLLHPVHAHLDLDTAERHAVSLFVTAGMVGSEQAAQLLASPEPYAGAQAVG